MANVDILILLPSVSSSHHSVCPARDVKGTLVKFKSEVLPLSDEGITDVVTRHIGLPFLSTASSAGEN